MWKEIKGSFLTNQLMLDRLLYTSQITEGRSENFGKFLERPPRWNKATGLHSMILLNWTSPPVDFFLKTFHSFQNAYFFYSNSGRLLLNLRVTCRVNTGSEIEDLLNLRIQNSEKKMWCSLEHSWNYNMNRNNM